jgi:ABC-type phosphate transport system substrate-binding protein
MRTLNKLAAAAIVTMTATALAMGPALADPINNTGHAVVPKATDVVGVGSDTTQFMLDQLSFDYNKAHTIGRHLYSWDALNPSTGVAGDPIGTKKGCTTTTIPRPNGSSAGILTLDANTADGKGFCVDFARSSRGRGASDPAKGPGGIEFLALAKDAVTYATNSTSNAPTNLTTAQLAEIYTCTVPATGGNPANDWADLGGSPGTINPELPQTSSGTRSFFLGAIGVAAGSVGGCVTSLAEENEGVDSHLAGPNVIFPYSIGKYIAQKFHSAACLNAGCTGSPACHPTKTQNKFGCDKHGSMVLRDINGTVPTTGSGSSTVINHAFTANFVRLVYDVVRYSTKTADHIPSYIEPFFASAHAKVKGWACTSKRARQDIINYGFLPTPLCGIAS